MVVLNFFSLGRLPFANFGQVRRTKVSKVFGKFPPISGHLMAFCLLRQGFVKLDLSVVSWRSVHSSFHYINRSLGKAASTSVYMTANRGTFLVLFAMIHPIHLHCHEKCCTKFANQLFMMCKTKHTQLQYKVIMTRSSVPLPEIAAAYKNRSSFRL